MRVRVRNSKGGKKQKEVRREVQRCEEVNTIIGRKRGKHSDEQSMIRLCEGAGNKLRMREMRNGRRMRERGRDQGG